MRRCSVAEGVVHGRELRLNVIFAETDKLECLHHDLRIVVTYSTGRQLDTINNQVILICHNGKRIDLTTFCLLQSL